MVPQKLSSSAPVCIAGNGFCPPENCGGPWGFMKAKQKYSIMKN
ncbi:IS1096 element passenger TnpR family protein [Anabaena catenula]